MLRRHKRRFRVLKRREKMWELGLCRDLDTKYTRVKGSFYGAAAISLEENAFDIFLAGFRTRLGEYSGASPEHVYAAELKFAAMDKGAIERIVSTSGWLTDPYFVTKTWSERGFTVGSYVIVGVLHCAWEKDLSVALYKTSCLSRVITVDESLTSTARMLVYLLWHCLNARYNSPKLFERLIEDIAIMSDWNGPTGTHDPFQYVVVVENILRVVVKHRIGYLDELLDYMTDYVSGALMCRSAICVIIGMFGGAILGARGVEPPFEKNRKIMQWCIVAAM